jgi:hypothetical protein
MPKTLTPNPTCTRRAAAPDTSPLQWWARAAADAHLALPGTPDVQHAEDGGKGPTTVLTRRTGGKVRHVLAVSRTDLELHSRQQAGKWVAAQAVSSARAPLRQRRPQRMAPTVLSIGALYGLAVVITVPDAGTRLLWSVIAIALSAGAVALVRYRRRRAEILTWSSDDHAARLAGVTAAIRALTPTAPDMYRTWLHSWLERRDSTSRANRLARLQDRAKA